MNPNKQQIEELPIAGTSRIGPPHLDPQVVELFKAMESELGLLKRRIFALESQLVPFATMIRSAVDYELSKRGLEITSKNEFVAKNCEASAWDQFKHKYNV